MGNCAGIDWASEVHVACVLDGDGTVTGRFSFSHDAAAIRAMIRPPFGSSTRSGSTKSSPRTSMIRARHPT